MGFTRLNDSRQRPRDDLASRFPFLFSLWRELGLMEGLALDLGCNLGHLSQYQKEYVGIDFTNSFLHEAKERFPQKEFIQADVRYLPFRDGSFDVVFAVSLLEHIPRRELKGTISRIARLLKAHGQFAMQIPNSRFIVELHTRIPFYYYLPKRLQTLLYPGHELRWHGYDLRWEDLIEVCEEQFISSKWKGYVYPQSVIHIPSWLVPMPMGYAAVFCIPSTPNRKRCTDE
jgi:SAM-dependent methyltransferase